MKKLLIKYTGDEASLFWEVPYEQSAICPRVDIPELPAEKLVSLGRYLRLAEGAYRTYGESAGYLANLIAEELKVIRPFLNGFKHVELELPTEFTNEMSLTTNTIPMQDFIELIRGSERWKVSV